MANKILRHAQDKARVGFLQEPFCASLLNVLGNHRSNGALGVQKLNSADADSETPRRLPHAKYLLMLLHSRPRDKRSALTRTASTYPAYQTLSGATSEAPSNLAFSEPPVNSISSKEASSA